MDEVTSKPGTGDFSGISQWVESACCLGGVRRIDGVISGQALTWTGELLASPVIGGGGERGSVSREERRMRISDTGQEGSSGETPVMGVERRAGSDRVVYAQFCRESTSRIPSSRAFRSEAATRLCSRRFKLALRPGSSSPVGCDRASSIRKASEAPLLTAFQRPYLLSELRGTKD